MDFKPFPKIPRLKRGCVVTEKIDGTNAQIFIDYRGNYPNLGANENEPPVLILGDFIMIAGSRSRWINYKQDNYGFAIWVEKNAEDLIKLGPGQHFGEWWGQGIQRNYGLKEKRFSLFNSGRWSNPQNGRPECCGVVPVLYAGDFETGTIDSIVWKLAKEGSVAAPGWMKPEGIVVFLPAANALYKVTCVNDEQPKGLVTNGS